MPKARFFLLMCSFLFFNYYLRTTAIVASKIMTSCLNPLGGPRVHVDLPGCRNIWSYQTYGIFAGIDLDALGTLPVNVDFSNISDGQAPGISVQDTSSAENTEEGKQCRSKRPRGPKPKYVFSDPEQAAAARRERNRATALQSYYKKKNHTKNLELQVWELEEENNKLIQLLQHVEEGSVSIQDEGDIEKHIDAISC